MTGGGGSTSVQNVSALTKAQKGMASEYINALMPSLFNIVPIYNKKGTKITGWRNADATPVYNKKGTKIVGWQGGTGGFKQPDVYGGQRLADVSPMQTQGLDIASGISGAYGTARTGLEGVINNLSGGMQDVFSPIYQQAQNLWQQQIEPGVMERFAGMGAAAGGGAQSALAREGQNLTTNLGAALAPYYMQAQTALPSILQQYAGMPSQEAMSLLGFGEYERGLNQEQLSQAQQIWGEQQPYSNPYLGLTSQVLPYGQWSQPLATQQPAGFGSSLLSGMAPYLGMSLGSSILGGGSTGALTAGMQSALPTALSSLSGGLMGLGAFI